MGQQREMADRRAPVLSRFFVVSPLGIPGGDNEKILSLVKFEWKKWDQNERMDVESEHELFKGEGGGGKECFRKDRGFVDLLEWKSSRVCLIQR